MRRDPAVRALVAYDIDRVEPLLDAPDLLAQQVAKHRDAGVAGAEMFERVHRDPALALLRFEIVGLALALLVSARQDRAGPDLVDRVGAGPPSVLRHAVFERPGD